jgi:glycosyltransferase involved in cell wall biosynthesis
VCTNIVSLVENGVDLQLWHQKGSAATVLNSTSPRFVFVGRLVDWKAVDLLLEAFARASARVHMRLLVIGDGPERARLEELAGRLGLTSVVQSGEPSACTFSGWMSQADCAACLRASDVLVLPSLREAGGAVVLEAMAAQLPVIATAWGGPMDYLDKSCGLLIEPASREAFIEGLSNAMLQLALNPEQRLAMGRAGRLKAERQFDWQAKVDRILQLYGSVIEGSPPPAHTP